MSNKSKELNDLFSEMYSSFSFAQVEKVKPISEEKKEEFKEKLNEVVDSNLEKFSKYLNVDDKDYIKEKIEDNLNNDSTVNKVIFDNLKPEEINEGQLVENHLNDINKDFDDLINSTKDLEKSAEEHKKALSDENFSIFENGMEPNYASLHFVDENVTMDVPTDTPIENTDKEFESEVDKIIQEFDDKDVKEVLNDNTDEIKVIPPEIKEQPQPEEMKQPVEESNKKGESETSESSVPKEENKDTEVKSESDEKPKKSKKQKIIDIILDVLIVILLCVVAFLVWKTFFAG